MLEKIMELLNNSHVQSIGFFLLMALEYWLGKTEIVNAGSTLEAILLGAKKLLSLVFKPKGS